ncbi:MAG: hypothetical protein NTY37_03820 [Methanothrix sp.]|nr:hypothetical protein [Methanothrix sp.]
MSGRENLLKLSSTEARVIAEELHHPVIEARELLTRIENGDPLIYDHVAIAGDIDNSRLDLPLIHCERPAGQEATAAVVASKIQIRNCKFLGNVNFLRALKLLIK